ncbi:MAG: glycosyltransferase [Bacteroidota bacterium]
MQPLAARPVFLWFAGAALAALLIQLFFFFRYFSAIAFHKAVKEDLKINHPVSVVVCVRNNLDNIKRLLESLLVQKHSRYEIIVVDDRSKDEVYEYLLELKEHNPLIYHIRIDHTPERLNEKKYALTMGIKGAKYKHIVFTDDDCLPVSENWLNEMQARFTTGKTIVLGYSPYSRYPGLLNSLIRFETFYAGMQYIGCALRGSAYMGVGRNLAYTKQLFLDMKGFYKHVSIRGGDDDLFINRAATTTNTAVCISAESFVFSEPKHTFEEWFTQKKRHYSVGKYYRLRDKFRLGLLSLSYAGFWLCLPVLGFSEQLWYWAVAALITRQLSMSILYLFAAKKLGEKFNMFSLMGLDFLYVFCFIYFSLSGLLARRISWD